MDIDTVVAIADRPNPPYFPIENGCALPDLSTEMEILQTAVMTRLGAGLAMADIAPEVIQTGSLPTMQCGRQGTIGGETLKLYLIDHNLMEVPGDDCDGGTTYRGRVSTLDPVFQHGEFRRIECAAMQLVMTGKFDIEVCAEGSRIRSLDVVPRADEPTTPGFTVESMKTTCLRDN